MIVHDQVRIIMEVPTEEEDAHGNPIVEYVDAIVRAEVFPLGTDQTINQTTDVVRSRYRMVLDSNVEIPHNIGNDLRIEWSDYTGPYAMYVDGTVERHLIRGRLHHYELTTKALM